MNEATYNAIMVMAVRKAAENLTDTELNELCLAGLFGTSPTQVAGYEKAKDLFTEVDGTRMHEVTVIALCSVRDERIGL